MTGSHSIRGAKRSLTTDDRSQWLSYVVAVKPTTSAYSVDAVPVRDFGRREPPLPGHAR